MSTLASEQKNRRQSMRRHPRGATQVNCLKGAMGFGRNLALRLLDVSEQGVRLVLKEPLTCGQEVELQLQGVSHRRPIKYAAQVVWCVPAADGTFCVGLHLAKTMRYVDLQMLV
jgi:hypothetical protein